jgi:hypothetical protein
MMNNLLLHSPKCYHQLKVFRKICLSVKIKFGGEACALKNQDKNQQGTTNKRYRAIENKKNRVASM